MPPVLMWGSNHVWPEREFAWCRSNQVPACARSPATAWARASLPAASPSM